MFFVSKHIVSNKFGKILTIKVNTYLLMYISNYESGHFKKYIIFIFKHTDKWILNLYIPFIFLIHNKESKESIIYDSTIHD